MKTTWNKENRPDNLEVITETDMSKFKKLKEGEEIKSGDYLYIFDNIYAHIGKGNRITKEKVSKFDTVIRKK